MNKELLDSISKMIPEGNSLKLPTDEQFTNYPAVKKCLLAAGGKYKRCAFIFPDDAAEVQARLLGGEAINDKKKYQFFPTPPELADYMVKLAEIDEDDSVLEPSAGQGSIIDAITRSGIDCYVRAVELMPQNAQVLRRQSEYDELHERDFLKTDIGKSMRVIANPPFTKNQDIDHIRKMYDDTLDGGRIVTLASKSWTFGSQKKQVAFREWLEEIGARFEEVPAGAFKESGTNIATMLIIIDK